MDFLGILFGIILLSHGGDLLTKSSVDISLKFSVPKIIIGINFRDDEENLNEWLNAHGNPFEYVIRDEGDIAFELGLIGVPETFFVDGKVIYKKVQGPIFGDDIEEFL